MKGRKSAKPAASKQSSKATVDLQPLQCPPPKPAAQFMLSKAWHTEPHVFWAARDALALLHGEPHRGIACALEGSAPPSVSDSPLLDVGCDTYHMDVLDSLVRTILSQNTTDKTSQRAFDNLKRQFPNWTLVMDSAPGPVEEAIRVGGLAEVKTKRIQDILRALVAERGECSLEHLRSMETEQIKAELSRFKGVGPKTIACVLMFCLRHHEFPVDTHVWEMSKQLGWVPASANRNQTYEHLNALVPNEIKYDLHVLMVTHGKVCPSCAKIPRGAAASRRPADVAAACPLAIFKRRGAPAAVAAAPAAPHADLKLPQDQHQGHAADVAQRLKVEVKAEAAADTTSPQMQLDEVVVEDEGVAPAAEASRRVKAEPVDQGSCGPAQGGNSGRGAQKRRPAAAAAAPAIKQSCTTSPAVLKVELDVQDAEVKQEAAGVVKLEELDVGQEEGHVGQRAQHGVKVEATDDSFRPTVAAMQQPGARQRQGSRRLAAVSRRQDMAAAAETHRERGGIKAEAPEAAAVKELLAGDAQQLLRRSAPGGSASEAQAVRAGAVTGCGQEEPASCRAPLPLSALVSATSARAAQSSSAAATALTTSVAHKQQRESAVATQQQGDQAPHLRRLLRSDSSYLAGTSAAALAARAASTRDRGQRGRPEPAGLNVRAFSEPAAAVAAAVADAQADKASWCDPGGTAHAAARLVLPVSNEAADGMTGGEPESQLAGVSFAGSAVTATGGLVENSMTGRKRRVVVETAVAAEVNVASGGERAKRGRAKA